MKTISFLYLGFVVSGLLFLFLPSFFSLPVRYLLKLLFMLARVFVSRMKIIVLLLFFGATAASAVDYSTLYNLSGEEIRLIINSPSQNGNTFTVVLPVGQSLGVERGSSFDGYGAASGNEWVNSVESPLFYISTEACSFGAGEWSLDKWLCFRYGLALALPVFGWSLGSWVFRMGLGVGGLGED